MILERGDKVLVAHRRLFAEDAPRYFLGVVEAYEGGVARATGTTWIRDRYSGTFLERPDPRTKVVSVASGTLILYRLPSDARLDQARFQARGDGSIELTDGDGFSMDLTETFHKE